MRMGKVKRRESSSARSIPSSIAAASEDNGLGEGYEMREEKREEE